MHRSLKQLHEWACIVAVTLVAVSTVHAEEGAIKPLDEQPNKEQVAQLPVADAESAPSAPAVVPIILPESIIIEVHAEKGYINESGNYVLDLLEQDMAYLAVQLKTVHGQLVEGVQPTFTITGKSRLVSPEETSDRNTTDEYGVIEFGVIGGKMGLDQVTVEFAGASTTILVNVISLESLGFPRLPTVEGLVAWGDLMRARIKFEDRRLIAEFPEEIANLAGKSVKLSGFMMPLEPTLAQNRFLLTSNPPSCFFHIPGGPTGAVEVLAHESVTVSWDPIMLEGRFEPQEISKTGVVYRLLEAKLVKLDNEALPPNDQPM